MSSRLSDVFATCLGRPSTAGPPALESALREGLDAARATWPGVEVDDAAFLTYLAERVPADAELATAVRALPLADMYLACACSLGRPRALAAFEERYVPEIEAALGRMRLSASTIDETKQVLRNLLFVGGVRTDAATRPKIADYAGRGPLRTWVRAAAVRAGLRATRTPKGHVTRLGDALDALPSPSSNLEIDYLKTAYKNEFKKAFAEGFASLSGRERALLQQVFGHELTIDEVAAMYRVHRATAARWITKARESLADATRQAMMKGLGVGRAEVSSILRLIESQLEASVQRLAQTADPPSRGRQKGPHRKPRR
jgi:RNA polymerase sigma-70 factor (ECF subfamily)